MYYDTFIFNIHTPSSQSVFNNTSMTMIHDINSNSNTTSSTMYYIITNTNTNTYNYVLLILILPLLFSINCTPLSNFLTQLINY